MELFGFSKDSLMGGPRTASVGSAPRGAAQEIPDSGDVPVKFVRPFALVCALAVVAGSAARAAEDNNWPALGGLDGTSVSAERGLPTSWSATDNVAWKTPIPGRGHSSPIIWGERIFLTTAIKGEPIEGHEAVAHEFNGEPFLHPDSVDASFTHQYRVVAIDARGGDVLWDRLATERAPFDNRHRMSSFASPTAVTDGERVYAYFGTPGLFAYDFDGNLLWSAEVGAIPTLGMGVGSSPILAGDMVIIQADEDWGDHSALVAFDRETGQERWRTARPVSVTWATPILIEGERDELVTIANEWIISYAPATGEELWRMEGLASNAIHRPLVSGDLVIATAGYPQKAVKAIRLGGSGDLTGTEHLAWEYAKGTGYVPSNLAYGDYVYLLNDQGILTCLDAATGAIVYEGGRMPVQQRFSASPVAYDGRILMPGVDGDIFVVRAGPEFEVLSTNSLDEAIWATPAIANGRIYIRTVNHLWAIGDGQ